METNNVRVPLLPAPGKRELELALFNESYPRVTSLGLVRRVKVYELQDRKLMPVDEQVIGGIQALIPGAFVLRVWARSDDREDLREALNEAGDKVAALKPGFRMLPSHPAWQKRTFEGRSFVNVLFGEVTLSEEPNFVNSRLTRLIGHIDEMSRYLGKRRFYIARGNHPWADHDGACLLNPSRFHTPWRTLKVFAPGIFGTDYLKGGAPTVKCCGEFNSRIWNEACLYFGIDPSLYDGIVPEISLKFDDGRAELEAETFSVFDSVPGRHFTVTLQMLMNMPLTQAAHKWAADSFIGKLKELREAYSDSSGLSAARLIEKDFKEAEELLEGECLDELSEGTEAMSALMRRILSGAPIETAKYLKGTLPLLIRRLKRLRIPGVSEMASADSSLKPFEVALSPEAVKILKKQGHVIEPGSRVIAARHPITGTEAAHCTVKYIGRTAVNPLWWAERFSGDFDGDRIAIGINPVDGDFIDEAKINGLVSPKEKTSKPLSVAEANVMGFWSQATIPQIDQYLRIANEAGLNPGPLRSLLQWVIDSAKHQIDFSIEDVLTEAGIAPRARMSNLAQLMSARLGSSKNKKLLAFNGLVRRARRELTHIAWMNTVRQSGELFYLIAGDPEFAVMMAKSGRKNANGFERFMVHEHERVLFEVKADHLLPAKANMEETAVVDLSRLDPSRVHALKRKAAAISPEGRALGRKLITKYNDFVKEIQSLKGTTTRAFRHIREMNAMVKDSQAGDEALKHVFASIVLGMDSSVRMKSTTIFGYLPIAFGSFNLKKVLEFLGYARELKVTVVKDGECFNK